MLLETSACLRQLGLACASRKSLRLVTTNNVSQTALASCDAGADFCRGTRLRPSGDFDLVRPQALPKFNPRKQAVRPFPNELFTGHSREKQEPRAHDRCCR